MKRLLRLILLLPLLAAGSGQYTIPSATGAVAASASFVAPTFVAQTWNYATSGTSVTTPALTATAGDIFIAIAGWEASGGTFSFSSSPTNTVNGSLGSNSHYGASTQMFVIQSAVSGSTTFTCGYSVSATYPGCLVLQYHPGSLTAVDTSPFGYGASSGSSVTTSTFSTTTRGLIVVCAYPLFSNGNMTAGLVGGVSSTLRSITSEWPACEDLTTASAQTSITGAMSTVSGTGNWLWNVVAEK